uniref:Uncharacterized protein n=1 Tax=viral metagenome TaxID=1070528 RepID=A0A6H2A2E4_9ZZZZ
MGAMVAKLSMDGINNEKVFFVRFYENMGALIDGKLADVYECSKIVVDSDVLEHLNDLRILENMRRK